MPERPELEYQVGLLSGALQGRRVTALRVEDPVVLRVAVAGDPRTLVAGRTLTGVQRRGHFVLFSLDGAPPLELAVHPMLAGRFSLLPQGARRTKDTGITLELEDGTELRYRDRRQMGKVYLLDPARRDQVPGLGTVGIDVLGPDFTVQALAALARGRRDQVKLFLLDKGVLDAFGNAYADETLFAAGIHPKTRVRELDGAALARLHGAMVQVLREAIDEVARRAPPLEDKVRDFLKVRNRKGEPCPVCGDPVRVCGVRGHDAFFCATCQPEGRHKGFVNWRRAKDA